MGTSVSTIPQTRRVFYCLYASLPTTGLSVGDLGYATDRKVLYEWDGSAWQPITIYSDSGLASAIPSASILPEGSLYYETDTTLIKQVQSGAWVTISLIITFASLSDVKKICKTANETVNNSATLQDDDELFFAVAANEVWEVFLVIRHISTPGFAFAFTVPSGGAIKGFTAGKLAHIVDVDSALMPSILTNLDSVVGEGAERWLIIWGTYVGGANAGTLQFQWCQETANVSNTIVYANSYLIAHRLSS